MSAEERIYKQLEELSSSIIRALEGLEKELSEYIEVTDNRLQKLEDKVHKLESLSDVSRKGLVQAIASSPDSERQSSLSHISAQRPSEQQQQQQPPVVTRPPPTPIQQPKVDTPPQQYIEQNLQQQEQRIPPTPQPKPVESPIPTPESTKVPPIPTPPSFQPVLIEEEKEREQPTQIELPERTEIKKIEGSVVEELKKKEKKEEDKDKDDLMSALKTIDSL